MEHYIAIYIPIFKYFCYYDLLISIVIPKFLNNVITYVKMYVKT